MSKKMTVTFSKAALPKSGALIVPMFEGSKVTAAYKDLDKKTSGALGRACKAATFTGKKGQTVEIAGAAGVENNFILICGAGKVDNFTALDAEKLGGKAMSRFLRSGEKSVVFALDGVKGKKLSAAESAAHIVFGAQLRGYSFDKYRTKAEKAHLPSVAKIVANLTEATQSKNAYGELDKIADGIFLTRDLVSEPPNVLYPASFAKICKEMESLGVKVEVLGEKQMDKLKMHSLLGVGQGSRKESQMAVMKWMGGPKSQKPICLVGKGVTFDTGGISLKPGAGMEDMKFDMGGAGAVTGAMKALAGRKAKANVIGLIGLVENMPDGNAQRPGDVINTMSGQTVEMLNTDAEGRMVLADVLTYAQEKFKPDTIIDLATLTGAIIVALAHEYTGMFTPDDKLAQQLTQAGQKVDEEVWRMPVNKAFSDMINSDIADMKNIGGRGGGSSTAAAFLSRFVDEKVSWAHLDIAGTAWTKSDKPVTPKGAVGYGVRLLDQFIRDNHEK